MVWKALFVTNTKERARVKMFFNISFIFISKYIGLNRDMENEKKVTLGGNHVTPIYPTDGTTRGISAFYPSIKCSTLINMSLYLSSHYYRRRVDELHNWQLYGKIDEMSITVESLRMPTNPLNADVLLNRNLPHEWPRWSNIVNFIRQKFGGTIINFPPPHWK